MARRTRQTSMPRSTSPLPPSQDLNLQDLELLHQYMTSTSLATAQLPQATSQMQTTVPRLAQTHPFLMRGLLAKAAVHLSWLCPGERDRYNLLAAKHHNAALPDFRSALQHTSEENFMALIVYSKGLVWCSFAWCESFSGQVQVQPNASTTSWLPTWFLLLRGSCLVVKSCERWTGNVNYMTPPPLDDLTEFQNSPDSRRISDLRSRLRQLGTSALCESVLSALEEAFARASMRHHNTPLRNAMDFWVSTVTDEYLQVLQEGEQWALVILAHFSILVSRSETRWFQKGHAAALLSQIISRLHEPWKMHVQWPCEEIGVLAQ